MVDLSVSRAVRRRASRNEWAKAVTMIRGLALGKSGRVECGVDERKRTCGREDATHKGKGR